MYGLVREFRRRVSKEAYLPEEISADQRLFEGAKKTIVVNAYERSSEARALCIAHWGLRCSGCDMNFSDIYGPLGEGYIHVHHLIPISQIGEAYEIDPIKDLRPVCPNCHAMLHKPQQTLSIEELKEILKTSFKRSSR